MLGNPDSISVVQVLFLSASGLLTVFLCLGLLILAILLLGKIMVAVQSKNDKAAPAPAVPQDTIDEEVHAVLISAVSAEVGLPVDKFRITSIKELS